MTLMSAGAGLLGGSGGFAIAALAGWAKVESTAGWLAVTALIAALAVGVGVQIGRLAVRRGWTSGSGD